MNEYEVIVMREIAHYDTFKIIAVNAESAKILAIEIAKTAVLSKQYPTEYNVLSMVKKEGGMVT